jgi:penicillin-binding protein 1A
MKWFARLLKYGFILGLSGALLGTAAILGAYYYLAPGLPAIDSLREVRFQVPLRVLSSDGRLIAEFGEKRREPLSYDQLPPTLIQAFLAAEDDAFFSHPGVDIRGLLRAGVQLALTGEKRQGGSTITMQVARNFFLSREKTYLRKLNEIFLAIKIDKALTKQEILELYLNKIYLGHRAYGVGAAAQVYYGKRVGELNLAQTAMIAGLPKAPSRYNPVTNPARAVIRRNYVVGRMLELGFITPQQAREARNTPVSAALHAPDIEVEAPHIAEMSRAFIVKRFGEDAYTGGYSIYTTIDSRLQAAASHALRKALDNYDQRHGYRGPEHRLGSLPPDGEWDRLITAQRRIANLPAGLVVGLNDDAAQVYLGEAQTVQIPVAGLSWARRYIDEDHRGAKPQHPGAVLQLGDLIRVQAIHGKDGDVTWRLAQIPAVAGALVSLSPRDGSLEALVGGYDFSLSKFNRATMAERQPGSGFKAFIYSAALDAGFTAASLINDAPVVFEDPGLEASWRPENYSGKFFGPTRLRLALTKSRNLVSIRLLRAMGIAHALKHVARFGFDTNKLPHNLSLALGSGTVTPLEMARGYAVLANGGYLINPYFVQRVEQDGQTIFKSTPVTVCETCTQSETADSAAQPVAAADPAAAPATVVPGSAAAPEQLPVAPRVISADNRYLMYSMMQDVITRGTGRRARVLGRKDLAGKTGTTNDQRDAWFNGYNQSLVTIAWVGFDNNAKLGRGEVGGTAALPAWVDYMRVALQGTPDLPPRMPADMVTVRIDPETGLRANTGDPHSIFEVFRPDHVPDMAGATAQNPALAPGTAASTSGAVVEKLF